MQTLKQNMVDRDLLDEARAAFTPRPTRPTTELNQIMYDAGCLAVLDWLDQKMAKRMKRSTVSVITDEQEMPHTKEASLRNLLRGAT